MEDALALSRCVVVVLCPSFVSRYNLSWFHLEHLITTIDVIYILRGGLDVVTVTQEGSPLGPAIKASIKNSHSLTWPWPIDDNAKLGRRDKLGIAQFWCHLKLAIPNQRRGITAACVGHAAAAPRRLSSDNDSVADVSLSLLV